MPTKTTPPIFWRTSSVTQTKNMATAIAALVEDTDLLVLNGDLGVGKTAFTQGFAAALGVATAVTSPTFTLANRYEGDLVINHLDVYRLTNLLEVRDLAIGELLEHGVTLIEWGERIAEELPDERLEIGIAFGEGDDERRIEIKFDGERWLRRQAVLTKALEAWL